MYHGSNLSATASLVCPYLYPYLAILHILPVQLVCSVEEKKEKEKLTLRINVAGLLSVTGIPVR